MTPGSLVCVGSGGTAGDIQVFAVRGDARLELISVTSTGHGVSYLSAEPGGDVLYATYSHGDLLSAFVVDRPGGCLRPLNRVKTDHVMGPVGSGASYVTVDATRRFLLVASYRGHSVSVWSIEADGRIGRPVQSLSAGRNAHCVRLDASNRWAFAPFLGSDRVAQFRFDQAAGTLTPSSPATIATNPGAGPRHIDFHPAQPWVFLVNELDGSLCRFDLDPDRGTLHERQRLRTLPADYEGRRWTADVHVAPSGRFVYVSNRAHDSIAIISIGPDGTLKTVGHEPTLGRTPRHFMLDADGATMFVANQESATLVTMIVDERTGGLRPLHTTAVSPLPYVICVLPPARSDVRFAAGVS